jgi:fumarate reductase flavoprotein subunit
MIKKYGGPESLPTVLGSYGDGINMALSAGAALDGMGPLMLNGAFMLAPGEAICNGKNAELRAMFRQSLLYVNSHGERFFNEEVTIDWPLASNAISREGKFTYVVFDAETLKEFQTKGYLNGCGNWIKRGQPMKKFDQLFPETAKEITKYAKQGKDERFGKNPRTLRAVEKGPFYVLKGQLHHLTSLGGSRVTEHLQVVNEQGNVIPGLYAVGGDAGGMYGDSYDLTIAEGAASSFAINGGRMAVKNIIATRK